MAIGVFDSGLGGLTVLKSAMDKMPDQAFVYYGDNANAPYGSKTDAEIYNLTIAGVTRLFEAGCDLVILACNSASAVALHDLQVNWLTPDKRVLGVFVPMIEELTSRDWGDNSPPTHTGLQNVALFATPATVSSGAFERELKFRARDVEVVGEACVGLAAALKRVTAWGPKLWLTHMLRLCWRCCQTRKQLYWAARITRWSRSGSVQRFRRQRGCCHNRTSLLTVWQTTYSDIRVLLKTVALLI